MPDFHMADLKDCSQARILIVDDDLVTRLTLEKTLANSGYCVTSKSNGREGLLFSRDYKPELVLLDVMMPEIDGFEICRRIREFSSYNEIKIIMLTGLNDVSSVDMAFDAGANDFITKPINWTLLVKRVAHALREREMYFKLVEDEAKLKQSQKIARLSYWEYDPKNDSITVSGEFCKKILNNRTVVSKEEFYDLVKDEDRGEIKSAFSDVCLNGGKYHRDCRIMDCSGNELIYQHQGEAIEDVDGLLINIIGTLQDITNEHHAAALIEYQKYYDELTNLPNKQYLYEELDKYIISIKESELMAILFVGVDRFKLINTSFGYKTGDEILKLVASRLHNVISGHGIVSRFSGDTFSIVINKIQNIDQLEAMIDDVLSTTKSVFEVDHENHYLSSSIGVVVYPLENASSETLLSYAEDAMSQAKSTGGNHYVYHSPEMNAAAKKNQTLNNLLRQGLETDRFELFYQPQIELSTGKCIGSEALIRMYDENNNIISPVEFIPVAEETGLIVELGYWIIEAVCKQINLWESMGMHGLRTGINLSARQFKDKSLISHIDRYVSAYEIPIECIDLEITESIAMDNLDQTLSVLNGFKDLGYTISMDDFGTGYSSLSSLQKMPIDILKIDRAFIKDIRANGENGEIARAILAMGRALNMRTIAEGAESNEHIEFLEANQCDEVQGFYYSPPLKIDKFNEFYAKHNSDPAHNIKTSGYKL
ncbi:MAG: EAL domain-containing protein [Gammaproteobacteria bacterium]|nr:EAL domain-containing protein [Gammaproteobacteria bacterium]